MHPHPDAGNGQKQPIYEESVFSIFNEEIVSM
jgi:hypothetical protein